MTYLAWSTLAALLVVIVKVDLDAQSLPELVDGRTGRSNEMWDVLPVDGELECIAIDNIVILGILDNRVDLNDNPVDL